MRDGREIALGALDWPALVRPGDLVVWAQASAEPVSLTAALTAARATIGGFRAFVGISHGVGVAAAFTDHIAYSSYCGTGENRSVGDRLDILPMHYGELAATLERQQPVVLLSLAAGADADHMSYGAGGDYIADLLPRARLVIAELSSGFPRTGGGRDVDRHMLDIIVRTDSRAPVMASPLYGNVERAIGDHIAGLVEDGATLQLGLGTVPAAALAALRDHRDLGLHSGQIGDGIVALAEAGIITNARKAIDRGIAVTGVLAGGQRLLDWADGNAALALRPTSYTHDATVLAAIDRFVAINSAIEVDLTGQVNAETIGNRYLGAVGGAPGFLRGAAASRGGLPIVALPSTASGRSRIVARLSGPVSTSRADAGIIVTEYGIADLRGLSLSARRRAMLAIAHPDFADALDKPVTSEL